MNFPTKTGREFPLRVRKGAKEGSRGEKRPARAGGASNDANGSSGEMVSPNYLNFNEIQRRPTPLSPADGIADFASCRSGQHVPDLFQFGSNEVDEPPGPGSLSISFILQVLPGALDGEFLLMEKVLDLKNFTHVAFSVHSLAGGGSPRADSPEFRFPEAQHVGGQSGNPGDLPDLEIELVRYFGLAAPVVFHLSPGVGGALIR